MREAALPAATLACHPLPGPTLKRRLVLIARQRELGPLPGRMAALCREVLTRMPGNTQTAPAPTPPPAEAVRAERDQA